MTPLVVLCARLDFYVSSFSFIQLSICLLRTSDPEHASVHTTNINNKGSSSTNNDTDSCDDYYNSNDEPQDEEEDEENTDRVCCVCRSESNVVHLEPSWFHQSQHTLAATTATMTHLPLSGHVLSRGGDYCGKCLVSLLQQQQQQQQQYQHSLQQQPPPLFVPQTQYYASAPASVAKLWTPPSSPSTFTLTSPSFLSSLASNSATASSAPFVFYPSS